MATNKTFKVFGISKQDGEHKVRFANDLMRIKVLAKHGHEDIRLVELPEAVTKYQGIQALQSMDEFQDAAAQCAISEYLADKAPKTPRAPKAPGVASTKKGTKTSREADALAQARAVAEAEAATLATENEPF